MDLPFVEALEPAGPAALTQWRPGDAWLAGGTWLFSEPQPALRRLWDLRALHWEPLRESDAGLEIGATCTLGELRAFRPAADWRAAPLFGACVDALYASWKVCLQATVGGNLCLALPAGPMTSLCAALDGVCEIWTPHDGPREVAAASFVRGVGQTALGEGELLRAVRLPAGALSARVVFRRASLTPLGRSAAVVIGRVDPDGTTVVCVTASVTRPLVVRFPEPPGAAELAAALRDGGPDWYEDVHGDIGWRRAQTARLAEGVRAELCA